MPLKKIKILGKFFYSKLPYLICMLFFVAFSVLAVVRHNHYGSFGYDLGINDQTVWKYANFKLPIATIAPFSNQTKFAEHVELVYILISPFYWIWSSPIALILIQTLIVCSSAIAVYLLARKYKINSFVSLAIMVAYLMFYGVQFGLWTDVHSSVFAAAFLMWFIYFADLRKTKLALLFFFLTLTAKESTGTALFFMSFIYLICRREKIMLFYMLVSFLYILFIYFIFYPYVVHSPYLYANQNGILSNLNPVSLFDTSEKRATIFYSFSSWGFIPLFTPLILLPVLSHFYKFFVIASDLTSAQGLFGQYRIMLDPVLATAAIWTIKKTPKRVQIILGVWLLVFTLLSQYLLHLPLSYLTKQWFWTEPQAVKNINTVINQDLPKNASIISQNNITPHISQRDKIYTLYPEQKTFNKNSPCGKTNCNWFRWDGNPEYLIVDTSLDWDARHLLIDRELYLKGLQNLERVGVIQKYKQVETTILYKTKGNPANYL